MKDSGFTLAELLIALAILGVIATFTIPKVLSSQQDARSRAIGKEAAAAVVSAYQMYRVSNTDISSTSIHKLAPYLNYVALQTSGQIDFNPGNVGPLPCADTGGGVGVNCWKLHSGAVLYSNGASFGGTGTTNAFSFSIDPDGIYKDTPESKMQFFVLFSTEKITTMQDCQTMCNSGGCWSCGSVADHKTSWFSWD